MKVSSPVGDFPFEADRLEIHGRTLVISGSMGAWPARVEVGVEDVPGLVRLIPAPVLGGLGLVAVALVRLLLRGSRSSGSPS
ncbi:MAG TPA: hypothetical protein VEY67_05885 [Candidatus Dormibacteraeota bacterium]|nr:hypothetical protein [Candidatus Dormibacteraeota bacterium]